mgnify:CR=1 FL=1
MQSDLKQICDAVAQVLGQEMRAVEFTNTNNGEVYLTFPPNIHQPLLLAMLRLC